MLSVGGDDVTIGILNPDGSRAEMSGNGTRIAAAWLMTRTGSTSDHRRAVASFVAKEKPTFEGR